MRWLFLNIESQVCTEQRNTRRQCVFEQKECLGTLMLSHRPPDNFLIRRVLASIESIVKRFGKPTALLKESWVQVQIHDRGWAAILFSRSVILYQLRLIILATLPLSLHKVIITSDPELLSPQDCTSREPVKLIVFRHYSEYGKGTLLSRHP